MKFQNKNTKSPNTKSPNTKSPNTKSPNTKSPNTKSPNTKSPNVDIILEEKSLLILENESRYCYSHGISFRKTDKCNDEIVKRKKRVSITFREIRKDPCKCKWPNLCDSQDGILEPTRL